MRQESECRRAVTSATKDFNIQQAEERKQRENNEQAATLQDNLTEIKNHVFGDMLTENPDVARSAFGSHRVITDRWKGMNQQQIDQIRETQAEQAKGFEKSKFRLKTYFSNILFLVKNPIFGQKANFW